MCLLQLMSVGHDRRVAWNASNAIVTVRDASPLLPWGEKQCGAQSSCSLSGVTDYNRLRPFETQAVLWETRGPMA
jgi:hypothetical protein